MHIHAQSQTKTFLHPHNYVLKCLVTSFHMALCGWESFIIKSFFLSNLMQILYLLGVGLLLTFDLLACVDSQGMLYYILMPKCNTTYHMLLKIYPFKQTPSPPLTEINLKRGNRLPSLDVNFYKAFFQGIKCQRSCRVRNRQRLSRVILNVGTVFLRSDAMATIFFAARYCVANIEGG